MLNACFTGHRKITTNIENLKKDMYFKLERAIINGGLLHYYCGGAIGFDMLAEKTIIELRRKYPQISLNLILPCNPEEQTLKWSNNDKETYYEVLKQSDSIKYISNHYYNGCMRDRNIYMIELADFCFCYYDKNKHNSGTGQTVRSAENKKIGIWNFYN